MGPIKIKIATTQIEGASEYDAPKEKEAAKATPASEYDSPPAAAESRTEAPAAEAGSCYRYEGSECLYTEPASGATYRWDVQQAAWVNRETGEARPAGQAAAQAGQANYKHDGEGYYYVDRLTMVKHRWSEAAGAWEEAGKVEDEGEESEEDEAMTEEQRKARQYRKRKAAPWFKPQTEKKIEKDPVTGVSTYTDAEDGVVYELDPVKNAWFPKIDEEFMANYQINYGFTKDGVAEPTKPSEESAKPAVVPVAEKKKKKGEENKEATWFDEDEAKTTRVYVENLPSSITEETFAEFMSKCGIVEFDIRTKKPKVKIYRQEDGSPKGDGLCTYIKPESVQLALTILDGSVLDCKCENKCKCKTVTVTKAKFEMKGSYDPKLKPKKLTKKQLEKAKKARERMFEWVPDKLKGERAKCEKVVVIRNMFTVEALDRDPGLILDYTDSIRTQCGKFGSVTKVTLYDKHPEGVCQVFFKAATEADMAVEMLNGRMFGQQVMEVAAWDGKTKYKMEESKEEEAKRLEEWEKHLMDEGEAAEGEEGAEEGEKVAADEEEAYAMARQEYGDSAEEKMAWSGMEATI